MKSSTTRAISQAMVSYELKHQPVDPLLGILDYVLE
jgi:hypothetical protein